MHRIDHNLMLATPSRRETTHYKALHRHASQLSHPHHATDVSRLSVHLGSSSLYQQTQLLHPASLHELANDRRVETVAERDHTQRSGRIYLDMFLEPDGQLRCLISAIRGRLRY